MARIRTIKPEFWEDEKIAQLPFPCRLFYIGCWNFADDLGVIKSNATLLKSWIFPYDEDLRVSEIKKWIDALVDARMFVPIISNGESYYIIRTFRNHQVLDKRYERSYLPKGLAHKLIEEALGNSIETTMCSHSNHIVTTAAEMEMEMEKENKEKELSNESPKKKGFDLSFVSPEYHKAFTEWLQYKKDRKETYKTQQSLQKCYTKLINLSGNNPSVAQEIVDQSIASNYAGLFELKKSNKPTATQQAPAGVQLGYGERIVDGRRTYGTGKSTIPMNAPPRPGDGYSWSAEANKWVY